MLAVNADEDTVSAQLTDPRVSIAAVNGPRSVVVAGAAEVIDSLDFGEVKTRRLRVSHAFHSPLMDPMLAEFRKVAENLTYGAPRIPVVSNVTGEVADVADPGYWVRHVREAVRFSEGVAWLETQGVSTFLELGPDGVLTGMAQESLTSGEAVASVRKDRPESEAFLTALGRLHVRGIEPAWAQLLPGGRRIDLPTYPFQHEHYWLAPPAPAEAGQPDAVDAQLWEAVEQHDLAAFGVDADQPLRAALPALADWRRTRREESIVDSWRYRAVWDRLPAADAVPPAGTWLVVTETEDDPLAGVLAGQGVATASLALSAGDRDRTGLAKRIAAEPPVAGVLASVSATSAVVLAQALGETGVEAPLWLVTSGAVATGSGDLVRDVRGALVWGVGRVLGLEQPRTWGGVVDLPETMDDRAGERLVAALAGTETEVAVRASGLFGRRLVPARTDGRPAAREWAVSGTVLVTGGTGALGGHVARWLAESGAERLVLVSRRGQPNELAGELGDRVVFAAADVSDRESVAKLLAEYRPAAVVHAAGIVDDGVLDALTPDRLDAVVRAKTESALLLDELTRDLDLSAFVLFSSFAGVVGGAGQAAYAAANTALDALAEQRRQLGLPATSVAWGPWAGGGMAAGAAGERARRGGLAPMEPARALRALRQAVEHGDAAVVVADVDWARFGAEGRGALFDGIPGARRPEENAEKNSGEDSSAFVRRIGELPETEQVGAILELVGKNVAAVLGYAGAAAVEPDRAFTDLGFDSLTAVELRNRLSAAAGLALPASLVFDHPNPAALAAGLHSRLGLGAGGPDQATKGFLELEALEQALAGGVGDEVARERLAERLAALAAQLGGTPATAGERAGSPALDSASDAELFEFIHKELGR